ncbi:MAG TPA: DUF488 domain-containing protein [Steroidobacteraceae bacterium]|nr:DUF488 domain-containing protein [Steroidobacteraceae bacterium]
MAERGSLTVYTLGHSTRPIAEFGELLAEAAIELLVDVRAIPRSRTNPQFNREALPAALRVRGIGYEHLAALGGRRRRPAGAGPSPNTFWRNESFRNYADYAATDLFKAGLGELEARAQRERCAIMCSETLWWRCHRRIISDYLIADGFQVLHILGPHKRDPAVLTPNAERLADGTLRYRAGAGADPGNS